jgi:hypothetical protein
VGGGGAKNALVPWCSGVRVGGGIGRRIGTGVSHLRRSAVHFDLAPSLRTGLTYAAPAGAGLLSASGIAREKIQGV